MNFTVRKRRDKPRAARAKWTKKRKVKDAAKEEVEVLYYPGCTAAYDPVIQPVAGWVTEVLAAANVDFGILGKNEIQKVILARWLACRR
jgi:Fe-S oxidoreductase